MEGLHGGKDQRGRDAEECKSTKQCTSNWIDHLVGVINDSPKRTDLGANALLKAILLVRYEPIRAPVLGT